MPLRSITPKNAARLEVVQQAQRGWIAQVVWSPDGRLLACGSAGGAAIWRGTLDGRQVFIKAHDGPVKGVAFAPNSATFATASADTTVKVWDLRAYTPNMQPINIYTDFRDAVEKIIFAPNGAVIGCGVDHTVRVLHRETLLTLEGHTNEVNTVALHPNGWLLASGGHDHTVRLWDLRSGEPVAVIEGHSGWVRQLGFHPDGDVLMSASRDFSARLWDIRTPAHPQAITVLHHAGDVRAAAFNATGEVLATGSTDNLITLWNTHDHTLIGTLTDHTMPVVTLAFNSNNLLLASGSGDNTIRLWAVR